MTLQLRELFLQVLQPLLLVSNVHHGGRVLLRLQQLLEFGELGLLLLVGNVQSLLNVKFVAFVLCSIGQRGVVQPDDLVNSPTIRRRLVITQSEGKLLPRLFLADLQFLAGGLGHLVCEPLHHLEKFISLPFRERLGDVLPRSWRNWPA